MKEKIQLAQLLIEKFSQQYKGKPWIPSQIMMEVVDDLYKRAVEIIPEEMQTSWEKDHINSYNGLALFPRYTFETPYILLKTATLKDPNYLFIGTLSHEFTHIVSRYQYYKYHDIDDYLLIDGLSDWSGFYYWDEFRATQVGYETLLCFIRTLDPDKREDRVEHILNTELPGQLEWLLPQLKANIHDVDQYLYCIMRFLGRFSVWNRLFEPEISHKNMPVEIKQTFTHFDDLYNLLYDMETFDDAVPRFDELKNLLLIFEKQLQNRIPASNQLGLK